MWDEKVAFVDLLVNWDLFNLPGEVSQRNDFLWHNQKICLVCPSSQFGFLYIDDSALTKLQSVAVSSHSCFSQCDLLHSVECVKVRHRKYGLGSAVGAFAVEMGVGNVSR